MGTAVEITIAAPDGDLERARQLADEAFQEIERIDRELGWQNPQGALGTLNRASGAGGKFFINKELSSVIGSAVAIAAASGGAFDPTVGPLTRLWSFEDDHRVPNSDSVRYSRQKVGYGLIDIDTESSEVGFAVSGMSIDLGAIAKGYAVDRAIGLLRERGVRSAMVDAGGDLGLLGGKPGKGTWGIGVQDPRDPAGLLLRLDLADTAIVTSGDYERFFEEDGVRYHHILDPSTGMPARGCRSVTVIAPTALEADACATAAFVLGPERGLAFLRSRPGVRGVIVDAGGALHWTDVALEREAVR